MTDNEQSLVIRNDDTHPEEETLSESLGGYQALVMLVAVVIIIFIVFALPTQTNPTTPPPIAEPAAQVQPQTLNLLDTLAGLTVEQPAATE